MPDILTTEMMGLYELYKKPTLFLSNLAVRTESDASAFELDERIIRNPYAIDTQRNRPGHAVDFSGYSTKEFIPPEYNEHAEITMDELEKKLAGKNKYEIINYQAACLALINDKQTKISDMYRRSEEKQVSDALFNGYIKYFDGTKIDYKKHEDQNLAVSKSWASSEGKPITDLGKGCDISVILGKHCGGEFNFITRGNVASALIQNEETQKHAGAYKKIDRVDISMPKEIAPGAIFHGQVSANGSTINLWSYDQCCDIPKGLKLAGEGTQLPYIPDGCGVLLPKNIRFDIKYAAVFPGDGEGLQALNKVKCQQLPWAYKKSEYGCTWIECGVKSRVLFIPTDYRSYVTYTNLLG